DGPQPRRVHGGRCRLQSAHDVRGPLPGGDFYLLRGGPPGPVPATVAAPPSLAPLGGRRRCRAVDARLHVGARPGSATAIVSMRGTEVSGHPRASELGALQTTEGDRR